MDQLLTINVFRNVFASVSEKHLKTAALRQAGGVRILRTVMTMNVTGIATVTASEKKSIGTATETGKAIKTLTTSVSPAVLGATTSTMITKVKAVALLGTTPAIEITQKTKTTTRTRRGTATTTASLRGITGNMKETTGDAKARELTMTVTLATGMSHIHRNHCLTRSGREVRLFTRRTETQERSVNARRTTTESMRNGLKRYVHRL